MECAYRGKCVGEEFATTVNHSWRSFSYIQFGGAGTELLLYIKILIKSSYRGQLIARFIVSIYIAA